jgi:putative ABC transport system permease protein
MAVLFYDVRYALRTLLKNPGFAAVVILTLALGIGACTVVFSTVYGLLARPLPFDQGNQLVTIQGTYPGLVWFDAHCSYANFRDLKEQSTYLEDLAAYETVNLTYAAGDQPVRVTAIKATANLFHVLGAQPVLGRPFDKQEDRPGANRVVLLNEGFWRSRLGADPSVVGGDVTIHNDTYRVLGIVPLEYEQAWTRSDIWLPLASGLDTTSRWDNNLRLIGRRKPGVTVAQVGAELDTIMAHIEEAYPLLNGGRTVRVKSILGNRLSEDKTLAVKSLAVAVALVLLIACANVANVVLARGMGRSKEMALRAALGAGQRRLVRQLVTENLVIALIAGGLGTFIAYWGVDLVALAQRGDVGGYATVRMDSFVLFFAFAVSLVSAVVFGLIPAWRASRVAVVNALKEGGRTTAVGSRCHRFRNALVVGEIGLTLVLAMAAGLMVQTMLSLQKVDPGFTPEGLLTMRIALPDYRYQEPREQRAFFTELLEELEQVPGITTAAVVDSPPLISAYMSSFGIEGRPQTDAEGPLFVGRLTVSSDYWRTMQIPMVAGRGFAPSDGADAARVVVVNQAGAKRFWPDDDPLGRRVSLADDQWYTIVGVAADDLHGNLKDEPRAEVFVPFRQMPQAGMFVVMRTDVTQPETLAGAVREVVWRIDPNQPVYGFRTMQDYLEMQVSAWRLYASVLTVFSAIALLLAAVGIYGVMSYVVSQRTHEIGVRIALGARVSDVLSLVLRQGALLTGAGLVLGVAGALGTARLLSSLLFGVSATDLPTLLCVATLLSVAAMTACYIPARRATKVDPMVALRCE